MPQDEVAGLSRRQMLRRGVAVGSVAWAVPTVTAITLTPASAAVPSGQPPEPSEPPKPPEKPPTTPPEQPPTQPPATPPTTPPDDETPKPKPPAGESPAPQPPPGDDQPVGGSELPDTGAGDIARAVTVGGLLAAGGAAAVYVASRQDAVPADGPDQGATA